MCRERPWGTVVGPAQARDGAAGSVRVAGAGDHGGAGLAVAGSLAGEEPGAGRPGRGQSSEAKIGELHELLYAKVDQLEARPFGPAEVEAEGLDRRA